MAEVKAPKRTSHKQGISVYIAHTWIAPPIFFNIGVSDYRAAKVNLLWQIIPKDTICDAGRGVAAGNTAAFVIGCIINDSAIGNG